MKKEGRKSDFYQKDPYYCRFAENLSQCDRKRRKVGVAKANKSNTKREVLVIQTTIKLIEK